MTALFGDIPMKGDNRPIEYIQRFKVQHRVLLLQKMTKMTQRASRRGVPYVCPEMEGTALQQYQC